MTVPYWVDTVAVGTVPSVLGARECRAAPAFDLGGSQHVVCGAAVRWPFGTIVLSWWLTPYAEAAPSASCDAVRGAWAQVPVARSFVAVRALLGARAAALGAPWVMYREWELVVGPVGSSF